MAVHAGFQALVLISGHRMSGHGNNGNSFDFGFLISACDELSRVDFGF
jgi:hypothetical protein